MKMSHLIQQLPSDPVLVKFRKSLEAAVVEHGDHEVRDRCTNEIELHIRARLDREFQFK